MSVAPVKAAPKKKTGAFERGLSPMQEVTAFVTNPYKFTSQLIVSAKGPIPDCVTFSHSLWGITLWRQGQAGNKASWLHSFVGAFFCNVGGGASLANLAMGMPNPILANLSIPFWYGISFALIRKFHAPAAWPLIVSMPNCLC